MHTESVYTVHSILTVRNTATGSVQQSTNPTIPLITSWPVCLLLQHKADLNELASVKESFIYQLFSHFKARLTFKRGGGTFILVNCGRELIAMPSMWKSSYSFRGDVCCSFSHPPYEIWELSQAAIRTELFGKDYVMGHIRACSHTSLA